MKYLKIIQAWMKKPRSFKIEFLLGMGFLVGALLILKILSRLILGTTLISILSIIKALLLFILIAFVIRLIEIKVLK